MVNCYDVQTPDVKYVRLPVSALLKKDMPYNCATPDKPALSRKRSLLLIQKQVTKKVLKKYLFSADGNGFINEIALCCDAGYCYGIVGWIICRIEVDGSASSAIGYCVCIPVNGCARIGEFTSFYFGNFVMRHFKLRVYMIGDRH